MTTSLTRRLAIGLRVLLAGVCCAAIWVTFVSERADFLSRQGTVDPLRAAISLVPDNWEYYMRLAVFDPDHAHDLLTRSLSLNKFNAQADIELGLQYEADGDYADAEKTLLAAYDIDHTYLPRWTLANFYIRRDNQAQFWRWARMAAEMPSDEIGPLFELCWRESPDAAAISRAVLNANPDFLRQYLSFLLAKDQLMEAAKVAPELVRTGIEDTDQSILYTVVNRLVANNDAAAADGLWRFLIDQKWAVGDSSFPNNPNFARPPLPVSFDWSLFEFPGLHSWPGDSGLEVEFTGAEPEECMVAEQVLYLAPGDYTLDFAYRTTEIAPDTGIRWQIVDTGANMDENAPAVIAESADLSSTDPRNDSLNFTVPKGVSLLRLRLQYHRAIGTPRISGMLDVTSTQIHTHRAQ